jgi:hypothetical protein
MHRTRERITAPGETFNMPTARNMATTPARPPLAGHRPLFAGEDAAAYDSLLRGVSDVVKPADILEEIWLRDLVEPSWEVTRLRRTKAEFVNSSAHWGLRKLLDGLLGWKEGQDLTAQWAAQDPDAIKLVELACGGGHEHEHGDGANPRRDARRGRAVRPAHRRRRTAPQCDAPRNR